MLFTLVVAGDSLPLICFWRYYDRKVGNMLPLSPTTFFPTDPLQTLDVKIIF